MEGASVGAGGESFVASGLVCHTVSDVRIIAGELRGRRLKAPGGDSTRPMLDRVREALFATLQPWIEGAFVLDLFAGSGALGIEALSRGARRVRFVERGAAACRCLEGNVAELGLADAVELVRGDALQPASWGERPADVAFLDAPYPLLDGLHSRRALFAALDELVRARLAAEGVLVLHAPHRLVRPEEFAGDLVVRERVYGSNSLWYVQRDEAQAAAGLAGGGSER
jgi:16S rRNA (guanine966-N2)-methyltransferase